MGSNIIKEIFHFYKNEKKETKSRRKGLRRATANARAKAKAGVAKVKFFFRSDKLSISNQPSQQPFVDEAVTDGQNLKQKSESLPASRALALRTRTRRGPVEPVLTSRVPPTSPVISRRVDNLDSQSRCHQNVNRCFRAVDIGLSQGFGRLWIPSIPQGWDRSIPLGYTAMNSPGNTVPAMPLRTSTALIRVDSGARLALSHWTRCSVLPLTVVASSPLRPSQFSAVVVYEMSPMARVQFTFLRWCLAESLSEFTPSPPILRRPLLHQRSFSTASAFVGVPSALTVRKVSAPTALQSPANDLTDEEEGNTGNSQESDAPEEARVPEDQVLEFDRPESSPLALEVVANAAKLPKHIFATSLVMAATATKVRVVPTRGLTSKLAGEAQDIDVSYVEENCGRILKTLEQDLDVTRVANRALKNHLKNRKAAKIASEEKSDFLRWPDSARDGELKDVLSALHAEQEKAAQQSAEIALLKQELGELHEQHDQDASQSAALNGRAEYLQGKYKEISDDSQALITQYQQVRENRDKLRDGAQNLIAKHQQVLKEKADLETHVRAIVRTKVENHEELHEAPEPYPDTDKLHDAEQALEMSQYYHKLATDRVDELQREVEALETSKKSDRADAENKIADLEAALRNKSSIVETLADQNNAYADAYDGIISMLKNKVTASDLTQRLTSDLQACKKEHKRLEEVLFENQVELGTAQRYEISLRQNHQEQVDSLQTRLDGLEALEISNEQLVIQVANLEFRLDERQTEIDEDLLPKLTEAQDEVEKWRGYSEDLTNGAFADAGLQWMLDERKREKQDLTAHVDWYKDYVNMQYQDIEMEKYDMIIYRGSVPSALSSALQWRHCWQEVAAVNEALKERFGTELLAQPLEMPPRRTEANEEDIKAGDMIFDALEKVIDIPDEVRSQPCKNPIREEYESLRTRAGNAEEIYQDESSLDIGQDPAQESPASMSKRLKAVLGVPSAAEMSSQDLADALEEEDGFPPANKL